MTETPSPRLPEAPRNSGPSLLMIAVLVVVFFLVVIAVSVLLLPDKGRRLLRLTQVHPVTQTVASAPPAPGPLPRDTRPVRIR